MLCLAGAVASAQVVTSGTIVVIIEDEAGARVPGATVTAEAEDSVSKREASSDAEGVATLVKLEPSARYVVTTQMTGFATVRSEAVLVRTGQTTRLTVSLALGVMTEEVSVTGETPVVDTTSAITGQDITLDLTESLPTGRSYQSYLQLVPGVLPVDPVDPSSPAVKSGLNYRDLKGESGISRDNLYYLDGINVTDVETGLSGADLNTEIIQEQNVITGGIPAEYVGVPGLVSNVVTKSGSNTFHGSVNYFFQNDNLVGEDTNAPEQTFSRFDTAFTLGGPIIRDKAWFFGSYRRVSRDVDVASLDTGELLRTVEDRANQWYARGTWAPTGNDTFVFTFMNDPRDASGSLDRGTTNARDTGLTTGGNRYSARYTRLLGRSVVLDFSWTKHNGEKSDISNVRDILNTVIYRATDERTLADEQLGGFGEDILDQRNSQLWRGSLQWSVDRHLIKAGVEFEQRDQFRDENYIDDVHYDASVASHLAGITAGELSVGSFSDSNFDPFNPSDFDGFITTVNGLPNRNEFYALYDVNGDGVISAPELGATMVFDSTAGNPHGVVNYARREQVQPGANELGTEGLSWFVQDSVQVTHRLTVNAGLRAERWRHFATTGDRIANFDWTWAPRLSAVYDLFGDGRQKITAYYGKYYDPIRTNMTQFAGTLTGRILEEQVYANNQWVNFRTRGGPVEQDAFFSPTTKTPWTDDLQLGYQIDLGQTMSFEVIGTKRRTRDLLEDYDLGLYALGTDGTTLYPGDVNHPDSLWLGLDYFGFTPDDCPAHLAPCLENANGFINPGSNFVIATLAGGKRDYKGVEFIFRKRFRNKWQGLVSYTLNDAEGNSNSDSNADFQGDTLELDPRAPNQFADQPGLIRHIFKLAGSYTFDFGLELGGTYQWNSGTLASKTYTAFRRNLPIQVDVGDQFEFAGFDNRWLADDAVGSLTNPTFGLLDLRVQYIYPFSARARLEVFADIFNVFNDQGARRNQDLVAGQGGVAFGEGIIFNRPRSLFLGARVAF
jgi:hypothetical protein